MGLKSKKILGISITISPKKDILEYIEKYLETSSKKPLVIATPNPEQIVLAHTELRFAKVLNGADVAIPDGIGLSLIAGVKRIPGVEFMEDLVMLAAKRGFPIGLIGGRDGVAVEALECLQRKYPGLKGWVLDPGYVDLGTLGNLGDVVEKIQKTNTRMVFVGLGAPKQEEFMARLARQLASQDTLLRTQESVLPVVFMSVGGSFDMIAGRTRRAPAALRAAGLEWLWRLVREPWRWRRQLALLKFLWLLASKGETLRG